MLVNNMFLLHHSINILSVSTLVTKLIITYFVSLENLNNGKRDDNKRVVEGMGEGKDCGLGNL